MTVEVHPPSATTFNGLPPPSAFDVSWECEGEAVEYKARQPSSFFRTKERTDGSGHERATD